MSAGVGLAHAGRSGDVRFVDIAGGSAFDAAAAVALLLQLPKGFDLTRRRLDVMVPLPGEGDGPLVLIALEAVHEILTGGGALPAGMKGLARGGRTRRTTDAT